MMFQDYQETSKRTFSKDETHKERVSNFSMGLSGEAGEVTDLLKKHLYHGHTLDIEDLEEELGDVLFYMTGIATLYGIKLEDVARKNNEKLMKRYPNGFDKNKSINRGKIENE